MSATQNFLVVTTANINWLTMAVSSGTYSFAAFFPYLLDAAANGITVGLQFPGAKRAMFLVTASLAAQNTPALAAFNVIGGTSGVGQNLAVITSGTTVARSFRVQGDLLLTGSGNLLWYALAEVTATAKILEGATVVLWKVSDFSGL